MTKKLALPEPKMLWSQYQELGSAQRVAGLYNCNPERIRKSLVDAGYVLDHVKWSDSDELALIRYFDDTPPERFSPYGFSLVVNRSVGAVLQHARKLGVLEPIGKRTKANVLKARQRRASLELIESRQGELPVHPDSVSDPLTPKTKQGKWQSGFYEVGLDSKLYLRSRWEYHWCLYLNWLKKNNKILRWEYEPQTFIFHEIEHGTRAYIPDFKVWTSDTEYHWEEVKGWMDPASATKLRRMAKYYPDEKIVLIDEQAYRQTEREVGHLIPGWLI